MVQAVEELLVLLMEVVLRGLLIQAAAAVVRVPQVFLFMVVKVARVWLLFDILIRAVLLNPTS